MPRPNILFLIADDHRFDAIRAHGDTTVSTPNLDALVRDGTTFTRHYLMGSTVPAVCMPSRAMMLTARSLYHLQDSGAIIPADQPTWPELLKRAGYFSYGVGKWHSDRRSFARSFAGGARIFFHGMSDHFEVPLWDWDPTGEFHQSRQYRLSGKHSTDLFTQAGVEFLRGYSEDAPFLLYLAYTAPHDPRRTHPRYHALYDPEKVPPPPNFLPEHPFDNGEMKIRDEQLAPWPRTPAIVCQHLSDYYAMITHMDEGIGHLLSTLRETGRGDNTIIIYTADHGLAVGQHGLLGKQNLYEHSLRIPLILRGSGIPRGEPRDGLCCNLDLMPTICELAGVSAPSDVEGQNLFKHKRPALVHGYKGFQRALRDERYKLIEYSVNGRRTTQLFDLLTDPHEMRDLTMEAAYAAHVHRLRESLQQALQQIDDPAYDTFKTGSS